MGSFFSVAFLFLGLYLIFQGSYIWALLALSIAISLPVTIFGIIMILFIVTFGFATA